jgi:hypothetical protein
MEIPEVRRRLRAAIEGARKEAQERRLRSDAASRAFEIFLEQRAVPAFQTLASALAGEGYRFKVFTPASSVRLASDGAADDYIELALDADADPPTVVVRTSRGRGRRNVSAERALQQGTPIEDLTEENVLESLLQEITPFV